MFGYWAKHPPVHIMVAAYLGIKPETEAAKKPDVGEFLGLLGKQAGMKG